MERPGRAKVVNVGTPWDVSTKPFFLGGFRDCTPLITIWTLNKIHLLPKGKKCLFHKGTVYRATLAMPQ